jgi:hypothetical protein
MLALIAIMSACSPFASKGTMPPPGPNGQVDASSAPDLLAVAESLSALFAAFLAWFGIAQIAMGVHDTVKSATTGGAAR